MTETATAPTEPDVDAEIAPADADEPKIIPLGYLVRHDKALVVVQGIVDDTDPGDVKIAHWTLSPQSMNPLAFNTGQELLEGATWQTAEEALTAAGLFVKAWSEMRDLALEADNVLRDLHLPGMHKAARSPFPPGGEIVE